MRNLIIIFLLLRFCLPISKNDTDNDITWSSRVVNGINIEGPIINRIENDIYLKRGDEKQFNFRNIIYKNTITIDIAPINSKICHRLFLWVSYMKNYFESNENELPVCSVNKCCKERFVTKEFASHNAVVNNELYDVLKVDLHKVMWWHSNKLRIKSYLI